MREVIRMCFSFALPRSVISLKSSRHFFVQSEVIPKPIVTRFPALCVGYMNFTSSLIGSLDCLCPLWIFCFGFFRRIMMCCNTKPKIYRYSENEDHFKGNDANRDHVRLSCTLRLHCLKIRNYKLNGPWMPSKP